MEKREPIKIPCCQLERVIDCDEDYIPGYRNKVEFTIGREFKSINEKGPLIVGFNQGSVSKGIMYTGRASDAVIISQESKDVATRVEGIVSKFNNLHGTDHYDKIHNKGFWRILLYRESKKTREAMISLIVTELDEDAPEESGMPSRS